MRMNIFIRLCRLEGELGEDWRILGDAWSLPRRSKDAEKLKNTEKIWDVSGKEQANSFASSKQEKEGVKSPEFNKEVLSTRESLKSMKITAVTSNSERELNWRENFLPQSSAFLEKLLKDRRNAGKTRTVTFGE